MMEELYLQCPTACEIILQYLDKNSLSNWIFVNPNWTLFIDNGTILWTRIILHYMKTHKKFMEGKTVNNGLEIWTREKNVQGVVNLGNTIPFLSQKNKKLKHYNKITSERFLAALFDS